MARKLGVALLGTGAAGIEFVDALKDHPLFEIMEVYGHSTAERPVALVMPQLSDQYVGRTVVRALPTTKDNFISNADIFCCALSDDEAAKERVKKIEELCAQQRPMVSTSSCWRYDEDSTIIIPEVNGNPHTIDGLTKQARTRNWNGSAIPGPNCTSVGPIIALRAMDIPLEDIVSIIFDSRQAVSGAGEKERIKLLEQRRLMAEGKFNAEEYAALGENIYEGNVRGDITGEIDKVKKELRKILGLPKFPINGLVNRVPVEYGHVVSMYVQTREPVELERVAANVESFDEACKRRFGELHSSPEVFVRLVDDKFGPQPILEAEKYGGMSTHIGQLKLLEDINGIKFSVLSHNLKKGAAKGSVQVMEYLHSRGYFII